jgi:hypothetical protein
MCPLYIHVLLQVLDGIFTYAGVLLLGIGTDIEGNPLVRWAMVELGPGTALVIIKGLAIGALLLLRSYSPNLAMLKMVISRLNLLYMLSAAMWAYVFLV